MHIKSHVRNVITLGQSNHPKTLCLSLTHYLQDFLKWKKKKKNCVNPNIPCFWKLTISAFALKPRHLSLIPLLLELKRRHSLVENEDYYWITGSCLHPKLEGLKHLTTMQNNWGKKTLNLAKLKENMAKIQIVFEIWTCEVHMFQTLYSTWPNIWKQT